MPAWIFQGNPDRFDIDEYLRRTSDVLWSVRQGHLAPEMRVGDEVFLWRSAGNEKGKAGVIARGYLTSTPQVVDEDEASRGLWKVDPDGPSLRVRARIERVATGPREIVDRKWLLQDPVVPDLRILKMANQTNYRLTPLQASRLDTLLTNTGRNWNRDESLAGLWAYMRTHGESVSRLSGSPVSEVSESIGRAVTGVYNKVMNFRALDPRDARSGLPAGSQVDAGVWAEFYDPETKAVNASGLNAEYEQLWGRQRTARVAYAEFGDAPNDDPNELQTFSARVRKGQPAFRKNLLAAYGDSCAITGWGPPVILEAVHIVPHAESGINELDNGLAIRADLHHLLDSGLLSVNPSTLTVVISSDLRGTEYWPLNGTKLRPRVDGSFPEPTYLRQRWGDTLE